MDTRLTRTDIGPLSLLLPDLELHHVLASHGQLWQWTGDGKELYTLAVAVRRTRLGTPTGVRHHLTAEVRQLRASLSTPTSEPTVQRVVVDVEGSYGAAAADLIGEAHGAPVRHRVLVSTDGEHMHVLHLLVPDSDEGQRLADRIGSSVRLLSWSMSA